MAHFTIKLEKEDIQTKPNGLNFLIAAQGVDIVLSPEAMEELVSDWSAYKLQNAEASSEESDYFSEKILVSETHDKIFQIVSNGKSCDVWSSENLNYHSKVVKEGSTPYAAIADTIEVLRSEISGLVYADSIAVETRLIKHVRNAITFSARICATEKGYTVIDSDSFETLSYFRYLDRVADSETSMQIAKADLRKSGYNF